MSTQRAAGIESTGPTTDELADQLSQALERLDAVEAENERLRTEIEEVHSELDATREQRREDLHALARENRELRSSHEQLEERVEEAETEHDELRSEIERAEASRGHIIEDIVDVEKQIDDVEAGSAGSKGGDDATETTMQQSDMTPIERISKMDAEDTGIDMTPSIERAVSIFEHWREWSEKTPKGRVLKDGLKNLLRTATGEKLAWRQVYRAAEALEELSKGRIEFVHHNRHGKMLIESAAARGGDCQPSSAVAR
jgi:predicted  nucleic acid-binding Zn-ribbon protein